MLTRWPQALVEVEYGTFDEDMAHSMSRIKNICEQFTRSDLRYATESWYRVARYRQQDPAEALN